MTEEAKKRRDKAQHYRDLAGRLTDEQVVRGLNEMAEKLEREADELEQHSQASALRTPGTLAS
jgi:hypothetical protein